MIEAIHLSNVATYGAAPEVLSNLSQFNYLFGSNGSGKTTISRVVANEEIHPGCSLQWKGGRQLQALVYNRDFVAKNFNQTNELKGIFTLGEQSIEAIRQIDAAKVELDRLLREKQGLLATLQGEVGNGGKMAELKALEGDLQGKCWAQKQKHDARFSAAFEGYRNSAARFKQKVLDELETNTADLESIEALQASAEKIFGDVQSKENPIGQIAGDPLVAFQSHPILAKRVIGKGDVDIAAMIQKLGNSDWVSQGRHFYENNDGICPFCQQGTDADFAQSLEDYFDDAFEEDSRKILQLVSDYEREAGLIQRRLDEVIAAPSKFLEVEKLRVAKTQLDLKITSNLQILETKQKESSRSVSLESLDETLASITALIDAANASIAQHSALLDNLEQERSALRARVWKYILEVELKADLAAYRSQRSALEKAIDGIGRQVAIREANAITKRGEIVELEKQTTSIQPTVDEINRLLTSFGFESFSLSAASDGRSYQLVRADGSDAHDTLSEGEKTFITFLYFFHLLKGSDTESGMTTDRVVVFDDPISSLDSDILFIVSSLIKSLCDEVRNGDGHIKQVFVLTHNVYFHKEVTFNNKRGKEAMNEETFWIVRRLGGVSKLERHGENPVKTSYELLWEEVRKPDRSNLTVQNTLRRILENYFKILGGVDFDEICSKFSGKDQFICRSLFSWINDGSHFANDDLYISIDESAVQKYLDVFKAIFDKAGHISHYRMMMGEAQEGGVSDEVGGTAGDKVA